MFGIFIHCAHLCKYRPCDSLLHRSRRPKNAGYSTYGLRTLFRKWQDSLVAEPYLQNYSLFHISILKQYVHSSFPIQLYSSGSLAYSNSEFTFGSTGMNLKHAWHNYLHTSSVHRIAPAGTGQHRHSKNIEPCPVLDSKEQFWLSGGRKQIAT